MNKENFYYILIAILAIVIGFMLYSFCSNSYYSVNYQKALSVENKNDVCKTPAGYTDEQWREHMSHHPDRYKECLGG